MNEHTRSFSSKVIVRTRGQTHTHGTHCSTWTTKVIGNKRDLTALSRSDVLVFRLASVWRLRTYRPRFSVPKIYISRPIQQGLFFKRNVVCVFSVSNVNEIDPIRGLQTQIAVLKKAIHYASWLGAGSKPNSITLSGSNQLRTSSEPASEVEFGFYHNIWVGLLTR